MKVLSSSHAKHCLGYHIVFCPKYRHQVLEGAIEIELKRIIGEICTTYLIPSHKGMGFSRRIL